MDPPQQLFGLVNVSRFIFIYTQADINSAIVTLEHIFVGLVLKKLVYVNCFDGSIVLRTVTPVLVF